MFVDKSSKIKIKWHYGIIVGVIVMFFGLYPQIALRQQRGTDFQGVFASNDLDEIAYAAYLQALIDNRPRKNDPYSGRDESAENSQPESIFSIQFLPPLVLSVPARAFGANASQMFVFSSAAFIFLTALTLFWLIRLITGDDVLAAVGALIIIVIGALVSGLGAIGEFFGGGAYPYLPFLRRYIPAFGFPFFFTYLGFIWLILQRETARAKWIYAAAAGFCFAVLVFSYFYLWTTAAAFLFLINLFWLIFRAKNWRSDFLYLMLLDGIACLSLLPYAYLLSKRAASTDAIQLLVYTHAPDLLRVPAIVCLICLILILISIGWQRNGETKFLESFRQPRNVFLFALALVPFIVFNQQILSGRSLQPFHYEYYVVNYVTAATVAVTLFLFLQKIRSVKIFKAITLLLIFAAVGWGYFEVRQTTEYLMYWNLAREEAMPVNRHLREIAGDIENSKRETTINFDYIQADTQPVTAPQAVLWARHQHVFAGVGWEENKERFYQLLYFTDRDTDWMRENFRRGDIEAYMALFGWDRFNPNLSVNYHPLTKGEIESEVRNYQQYSDNFSSTEAVRFPLKYAVALRDRQPSFENLDKWYQRDAGEIFGKYIFYRLQPKIVQSPK